MSEHYEHIQVHKVVLNQKGKDQKREGKLEME